MTAAPSLPIRPFVIAALYTLAIALCLFVLFQIPRFGFELDDNTKTVGGNGHLSEGPGGGASGDPTVSTSQWQGGPAQGGGPPGLASGSPGENVHGGPKAPSGDSERQEGGTSRDPTVSGFQSQGDLAQGAGPPSPTSGSPSESSHGAVKPSAGEGQPNGGALRDRSQDGKLSGPGAGSLRESGDGGAKTAGANGRDSDGPGSGVSGHRATAGSQSQGGISSGPGSGSPGESAVGGTETGGANGRDKDLTGSGVSGHPAAPGTQSQGGLAQGGISLSPGSGSTGESADVGKKVAGANAGDSDKGGGVAGDSAAPGSQSHGGLTQGGRSGPGSGSTGESAAGGANMTGGHVPDSVGPGSGVSDDDHTPGAHMRPRGKYTESGLLDRATDIILRILNANAVWEPPAAVHHQASSPAASVPSPSMAPSVSATKGKPNERAAASKGGAQRAIEQDSSGANEGQLPHHRDEATGDVPLEPAHVRAPDSNPQMTSNQQTTRQKAELTNARKQDDLSKKAEALGNQPQTALEQAVKKTFAGSNNVDVALSTALAPDPKADAKSVKRNRGIAMAAFLSLGDKQALISSLDEFSRADAKTRALEKANLVSKTHLRPITRAEYTAAKNQLIDTRRGLARLEKKSTEVRKWQDGLKNDRLELENMESAAWKGLGWELLANLPISAALEDLRGIKALKNVDVAKVKAGYEAMKGLVQTAHGVLKQSDRDQIISGNRELETAMLDISGVNGPSKQLLESLSKVMDYGAQVAVAAGGPPLTGRKALQLDMGLVVALEPLAGLPVLAEKYGERHLQKKAAASALKAIHRAEDMQSSAQVYLQFKMEQLREREGASEMIIDEYRRQQAQPHVKRGGQESHLLDPFAK